MIKLILVIQFVLELQWILRLAFSPMQLDFESAPFSHLGTSPETFGIIATAFEKIKVLPVLFYQFQNFLHFFAYDFIILSYMRPQATGTVLNPLPGIPETATTLVTQTVQRTVAEQTAEGFRIRTGMAGKIFAFPVLKKIVVRHILSSKYFSRLSGHGIINRNQTSVQGYTAGGSFVNSTRCPVTGWVKAIR